MTGDIAIECAERSRSEHNVWDDAEIEAPDQQYIELAQEGSDAPPIVRDALVWLVRYRSGISWIELAVDDNNGKVVRVMRSR